MCFIFEIQGSVHVNCSVVIAEVSVASLTLRVVEVFSKYPTCTRTFVTFSCTRCTYSAAVAFTCTRCTYSAAVACARCAYSAAVAQRCV